MQRRTYLAATGMMVARVAGVSGERGTVTAQDDQFELVDVTVPEDVEVMTPFAYSFTVANTGEEDAEFWTYFSRDAWGEERSKRLGVEIPAGEDETLTVDTAHAPYTGSITYHIHAFNETISLEAVPAYREIGDSWRSPDDVVVRITDLEFTETYEYEDFDGSTAEEPAPDGSQWAFVWLEAENVGDESVRLPWENDITIISDDEQFEDEFIQRDDGAYESNSVEAGVVRDGWIAYELPADRSAEDVAISYTDDDFVGEWTARWASTLE